MGCGKKKFRNTPLVNNPVQADPRVPNKEPDETENATHTTFPKKPGLVLQLKYSAIFEDVLWVAMLHF
jgi:hypothetical protein